MASRVSANFAIVDALGQAAGLTRGELLAVVRGQHPDMPVAEIADKLRHLVGVGTVHAFTLYPDVALYVLRPAPLLRLGEDEACTACARYLGQPGLDGLCDDCAEPCRVCQAPTARCYCADDFDPTDPI